MSRTGSLAHLPNPAPSGLGPDFDGIGEAVGLAREIGAKEALLILRGVRCLGFAESFRRLALMPEPPKVAIGGPRLFDPGE